MSNPDVEIQKLMRRVDGFAARLNPGLFAIAIVLSVCLLVEITVQLPALCEAEIASNVPGATTDSPALLTGGVVLPSD